MAKVLQKRLVPRLVVFTLPVKMEDHFIKGVKMILIKRKQKLAAYLRRLGYDAHVRNNYVTVNGDVNDNDLATVDIPMSDLEVYRRATGTRIIPREIQALA